MLADREAGARGAPAILSAPVHPALDSNLVLASLVPAHDPLAMPQQNLSAPRVAPLPERDGRWRLWTLVVPALMVTMLAASQSYALLSADGMSVLEWIGLALFAANLAWITSAAATAVAGVVILLVARKRAAAERPFRTRSRTAIVFPIRNEHPGRVMGGAQAVHDSLARADADEAFEIFFLSDTTDAELAREEEAAFRRLRQSRPDARMFYRRRTANHGRKAGNVADFVRNWGCSTPTA
jgi:membrane glycosyltransferase